jgi:hypothetical protein
LHLVWTMSGMRNTVSKYPLSRMQNTGWFIKGLSHTFFECYSQANTLINKADGEHHKDDDYPREESCRHWVNFSHFVAACSVRHLSPSGWRLSHASRDIPGALNESKYGPGPNWDADVLVAAHYILLTGSALMSAGWFQPDDWERWAAKLARISNGEGTCDASVIAAAGQAHDQILKLISNVAESTDGKRDEKGTQSSCACALQSWWQKLVFQV